MIASWVIWGQDLYIDTINFFYGLWLKILIWYIMRLTQMFQMAQNTPKLLKATDYKTGMEITPIIAAYYFIDKYHTCASLYRWLAKFNLDCTRVNIIYHRSPFTHQCVIDIENDKYVSGMDIPDSDISLRNLLPSANLYDYDVIDILKIKSREGLEKFANEQKEMQQEFEKFEKSQVDPTLRQRKIEKNEIQEYDAEAEPDQTNASHHANLHGEEIY